MVCNVNRLPKALQPFKKHGTENAWAYIFSALRASAAVHGVDLLPTFYHCTTGEKGTRLRPLRLPLYISGS
jgi:hypothetical protein